MRQSVFSRQFSSHLISQGLLQYVRVCGGVCTHPASTRVPLTAPCHLTRTCPFPPRSGYTAKVAGTEQGVTEPEATFSACFGSAFLMWHPVRRSGPVLVPRWPACRNGQRAHHTPASHGTRLRP